MFFFFDVVFVMLLSGLSLLSIVALSYVSGIAISDAALDNVFNVTSDAAAAGVASVAVCCC